MEMWQFAAVVIGIGLLIAVAAGAWIIMRRRREEQYAERFGPEYERAVREAGDRSAAQRELDARAERVSQLDIRPLSRQARDRFSMAWTEVQADFVDDPSGTISRADRLVTEVMEARGYPVEDFEQRAVDVSVEHPRVVDSYRTAHAIAEQHAAAGVSTEDLRTALVSYRALFDELLEVAARQPNGGSPGARYTEPESSEHVEAHR